MAGLLAPLIVLAILYSIVSFFRLPVVKGKCGELLVAFHLKNKLEKEEYELINNVMIPDGAGGSTQIDHIILSQFGIFVIETKTMKGWIFGDRNSANWTQQIYKCKNQFQNPFRQNYKHIRCLAELTGLPMECFIHTIVFVGDCTIKTRDKLPEALVENSSQLLAFIKKFNQRVLSSDMLEIFRQAVVDNRINNTFARQRQHVEYVRQIIEDKRADTVETEIPDPPDLTAETENPDPPPGAMTENTAPQCPRCGSLMVLRQVRSGVNAGNSFWGCSNYPRCRAIINIE